MVDIYETSGATHVKQKLVDLGDGTYAPAVEILAQVPGTEVIVGGASSLLGKITAPVNAAVNYFRYEPPAGHDISWRVKSDVVHTVQKYRARSIVDSITVTLAGMADTETATINGVTFTAEDTATDALRSAHKYYTGGADATADAVELVKGINRGAYVTVGTVAIADTITINGVTFTAAATAVVPSGVFSQAGTPTEDAASLVLCINHKDTVTLASCAANDTITINGLVFTAHAATTTVASRQFSIAGTNTQDGDQLVLCINDRDTITLASAVANDSVTINGLTFKGKTGTAVTEDRRFSVDVGDTDAAVSLTTLINHATYGVPGVTATSALGVITLIPDYGTTITMATGTGGVRVVCKAAAGVEGITAANAAGVVSLTRNSEDYTITMTSSNGTRAAVATARGVPGVLATSNAAEVDIAPTWADEDITVAVSADTMTWGRYGIPGVTATSALGVVTVVPKTTGGATCLQSVTGTAAGHWAVASTTLTGLELDGAVVTDDAANSTTAGKLYTQTLSGYEQGYLGITNKSGAGAMTLTVGATPL